MPARNKSTFKNIENKGATRKRTGKMVSLQDFDPEVVAR